MQFKELSRPLVLILAGGMISAGWTGKARGDGENPSGSIHWRSSYAKAAEEASAKDRPLLIKFSADWCGACQQMQKLTFTDQRLVNYVDSAFVPLVIDADEHSELVSGFRIEAFPTTLVVSPDLKVIKRFVGFQSASTLLPDLEKVVREKFAGREVVQPASANKPSNSTSPAFDGFCLVSILDEQKLRRGDAQFKTTYRDQELCFNSEEKLKKFQANPAKYWPVANGKCLVSERDSQQEAAGDPRLGVTWRGRLWLFSDKEYQQRFIRTPRKYSSSGM